MNEGIQRLKGLSNGLYLALNLLQFFLFFFEFLSAFSCLLDDLVLPLNDFNLLIVLNKPIKVSEIVVNNLYFIGSFVDIINIVFQLFLQGLDICCLVCKVLYSHHIVYWVDDFVVFLHLLND